jgi:hypothetical protein
MRPTKIHCLPTNLRRSKETSRQAKKTRAPRDDIHRLVHEIANQLTIINLSCFKLRAAAAKGLPATPLEELENVERAVVEMTNLIQILRRPENEPTSTTNSQSPVFQPATNVYRLFDSTQER